MISTAVAALFVCKLCTDLLATGTVYYKQLCHRTFDRNIQLVLTLFMAYMLAVTRHHVVLTCITTHYHLSHIISLSTVQIHSYN